ncbi:hypothetical protein B0T14DRAFT_517419 [Immersiella caudata]|uniref:Uncharacterized protein n=1 Tax=Immersiella caudata TaxID=314043 RepID=A0AA40C3I1_9PEZI|nr:hypothetical protein B0T14DRAFT_517419 [Immersiella caudata]
MPLLAITDLNLTLSALGGWVTLSGLFSYVLKEEYYLSDSCQHPFFPLPSSHKAVWLTFRSIQSSPSSPVSSRPTSPSSSPLPSPLPLPSSQQPSPSPASSSASNSSSQVCTSRAATYSWNGSRSLFSWVPG